MLGNEELRNKLKDLAVIHLRVCLFEARDEFLEQEKKFERNEEDLKEARRLIAVQEELLGRLDKNFDKERYEVSSLKIKGLSEIVNRREVSYDDLRSSMEQISEEISVASSRLEYYGVREAETIAEYDSDTVLLTQYHENFCGLNEYFLSKEDILHHFKEFIDANSQGNFIGLNIFHNQEIFEAFCGEVVLDKIGALNIEIGDEENDVFANSVSDDSPFWSSSESLVGSFDERSSSSNGETPTPSMANSAASSSHTAVPASSRNSGEIALDGLRGALSELLKSVKEDVEQKSPTPSASSRSSSRLSGRDENQQSQ